jgi:hypothetical protein
MFGAAFAKSSGVIAGMNSTLAFAVKNHGSARAGICDTSDMFTTMIPPRWPLSAVKYTASGFCSAKIDWMICPSFPARTTALRLVSSLQQRLHALAAPARATADTKCFGPRASYVKLKINILMYNAPILFCLGVFAPSPRIRNRGPDRQRRAGWRTVELAGTARLGGREMAGRRRRD